MKDLIIIGSGGLGRETAWTAERINAVSPEWNILGFIDDNIQIQGHMIDGYRVIGTVAAVSKYPDAFINDWVIPNWNKIVDIIEADPDRVPF